MALVEVLDASVVGRRRGDFTTAEQEGTQGDVVPAEWPIVLDDTAVDPGHQERDDDQRPASTDTDNDASRLGAVEIGLDLTPLGDDKHAKKCSSDTKVEGDCEEGHHYGVLAEENAEFGNQEDDRSETSRDARSDDPCKEHGNDTTFDLEVAVVIPCNPSDVLGTDGGNTHTEDTAKDGVGGGDGETNLGCHGEKESGGDDGAKHAEHEHRWVIFIQVRVDNLGSNSIGHTSSSTHGSRKLHHTGCHHGLEVGQRSRSDRCSPRVGNIVGTFGVASVSWLLYVLCAGKHQDGELRIRTNVPSIEEGKDCAYGKNVVVLLETHGDYWGAGKQPIISRFVGFMLTSVDCVVRGTRLREEDVWQRVVSEIEGRIGEEGRKGMLHSGR